MSTFTLSKPISRGPTEFSSIRASLDALNGPKLSDTIARKMEQIQNLQKEVMNQDSFF